MLNAIKGGLLLKFQNCPEKFRFISVSFLNHTYYKVKNLTLKKGKKKCTL